MALNINAPVVSTEIPKQRNVKGREGGPNFFLEAHPEQDAPEGYLAKSFDDGKWYEVQVQGHWEDVVMNKGKNKGQTTRKVVGEAAEVARQLREAATTLGVGVSIKYFPVLNKNKTEAKDLLLVKYLGTNRKQKRAEAEEE